MAKGKRKNLTNRNQEHWASSEPRTTTTASPRYPNTPEKQDLDLKSYIMMLVEDFKKDINNPLKEIQENTANGTGPVLSLHLLPGGRSERQVSVHLPCKRRACLQGVL
jgi:hypothetical protein